MKVFLDTNVVLDVLLGREPFYADSLAVLARCERKLDAGFVSALTFSTASYVLRKAVGEEKSLGLIADLRQIVSISPVSERSVDWAIEHHGADFEDDLQYDSAASVDADVIVTRDPVGFADALIRVTSPAEYLAAV